MVGSREQLAFQLDTSAPPKNRSDLLTTVATLLAAHREGKLGGDVMPEDVLIGVVAKKDLPDVITLGMSLNFQRNSYRLWEAVARAYADPRSRWVFDFERVLERDPDELRLRLVENKIALQPNKHPAIWTSVSRGIHTHGGSTSSIISNCHNDIRQIRALMQVASKKDFPYISGPKIFNYWLYVLEQYCEVRWMDRGEISVAPDTHVMQASVRLGLVDSSVLVGSADAREVVADAWRNLLAGTDTVVIDVHTPLWLWSKAGFPTLKGGAK